MSSPLIRFAVVMMLAAGPVAAQEYCVSCTQPEATYRCVIIDARPGNAQPLQVSCLTALARDGGHAQCSVKRGVTIFECDAPVKRVSVGTDPKASVPVDGAPVLQPTPVVVAPPQPAAVDPAAPPKTLLEAAQRASRAADDKVRENNEKLKDAGNATGSFLKRSLTCLGSLFTQCGP
jgi:hypothetical protein